MTKRLLRSKVCVKCCKRKRVEEFYHRSSTSLKFQALCKICWNAKTKAWHSNNRERAKEMKRQWRDKNKQKKTMADKLWVMANPEKVLINKKRYRYKQYGLTFDDACRLLQAQKNRCAICCRHQRDLSGPLCIDHDHSLGVVRGYVCKRCNTSLGGLGDTLEGVLRAVEYLRDPPAQKILGALTDENVSKIDTATTSSGEYCLPKRGSEVGSLI